MYVLTKFSSYKYVLTKMTCIFTYNRKTGKKFRKKSHVFKNESNWCLTNPISKIYKTSIDKSPLKIEIRPLKVCTTIPCLEARAEMNFFTDFKLNLFIPSGILCSDTPYCLKSVKHLRSWFLTRDTTTSQQVM